jgi:serine/threonine-protein kinase
VISTNPRAGASQAKGSAVQLVVSSGKKAVTIPPLVGQSPTAAAQQLGALQLTVAGPITEPSLTVKSGQVTRTDPAAGSSVPIGSSVTLYVSTGPQQVTVPDLRLDTQAQATAALQALGLVGKFTTQPVDKRRDDGIVISQDPKAGTTVAQNSTINVVIGSFNGTTSTTSNSSTTSTPSTTVPFP